MKLLNIPHYYILFVIIIGSMYSTNVISQDDFSYAGPAEVALEAPKPDKAKLGKLGKLGFFGCILGGFVGTFLFPGVGTVAGCAFIGGGAVVWDVVEDSGKSDSAGLINDNLTAHYVI